MSVKEKFLDYVSYDTQSDSSSTTMPSTMKQKLLAQHLADEMVAMGIEDAHMDEWGYVYGTIPANCEKKNVVGFIAHMDTAEEVSGANVKARVIENYDGEDIVLNKELGIVTDVENFPILKKFKGKPLIVTDGTTLLGADDQGRRSRDHAGCGRHHQKQPPPRRNPYRIYPGRGNRRRPE